MASHLIHAQPVLGAFVRQALTCGLSGDPVALSEVDSTSW
jgi:hypothetical protein